MLNDWALPKMSEFGVRCAGHEGAGVIVKVGERVRKYKVGQRAGYKPIQDTCGVCEHCKAGKEVYCGGAVLTGLHIDGRWISIAVCEHASLTTNRILPTVRQIT